MRDQTFKTDVLSRSRSPSMAHGLIRSTAAVAEDLISELRRLLSAVCC